MNEKALIVQYKEEINHQLSDASTLKSLMEVTFKGLQPDTAKRAMLEGYFKGFKFPDFLKKDVYAVPFSSSYSLVTSIDYARKIGAANGVCGKDEPIYGEDPDLEGLPGGVFCKITLYKLIGKEARPFTAKVYLKEYTTGKNLWASKPRTMIAKVAEGHALRMACPEQLAKVYMEEEFDKENAREGSYTFVRRQSETYEGEEIADDAVVVSTGDDTPGLKEATPHKRASLRVPQTKKWSYQKPIQKNVR